MQMKQHINLSYTQSLVRNLTRSLRSMPRSALLPIGPSSSTYTTESDPRLSKLIQWRPIQEGEAGILETLRVMRLLATEGAQQSVRVRSLSDLVLIYGVAGLDNWLRRFFVYRDELEEVVRTPDFMLDQLQNEGRIEGDCDDIATLAASIAAAANQRCQFVAIDSKGEGLDHVFVRVFQDRWIVVDPTVKYGTQYDYVNAVIVPVSEGWR